MKILLLCLPIAVAILVVQSTSAQILYSQNFESYANGSSADSWYGYAGGGGSSTPNAAYVTNYLGSQAYQVSWDSTLDASSYQYAGIGGGNGGNGIIPASGDALSQITLSLNLAENGSTSTSAFVLYLDQYGGSGGSQSWQEQFNPTTTTDGSFTTFSSTLNLGTSLSGTYSSELPIFVGIDNNSGFADATGDQMIVDDVLVTATAVPEPASLALMGLGVAGLLAMRRWNS
jgi:hypothetical protein